MDNYIRALYVMNGIDRPLQEGIFNNAMSAVGKMGGRAVRSIGKFAGGVAGPAANATKGMSGMQKFGTGLIKNSRTMMKNSATTGKIMTGGLAGAGVVGGGGYMAGKRAQRKQTAAQPFYRRMF